MLVHTNTLTNTDTNIHTPRWPRVLNTGYLEQKEDRYAGSRLLTSREVDFLDLGYKSNANVIKSVAVVMFICAQPKSIKFSRYI